MLSARKRHQIHLHFIVLLFGFTAILGNLIDLDAVRIVWVRMGIAVITLLAVAGVLRRRIYRGPEVARLFATGLVIALHWIAFFGAVKVSNVAITLTCIATGPFFTSLLEPLFYRRRVSMAEILLGVMTILGMGLIFSASFHHLYGILLGLASALLGALFAVLNGRFVARVPAFWITTYEMIGGFLAVGLFLLFSRQNLQVWNQLGSNDWVLLGVLGVICTAYAFIVSVDVMRELSPFTVVLSINLEPVYGILLAYFIFGEDEQMSIPFYIGSALTISSVFINAIWKGRQKRLSQTAPENAAA